MNLDAPEDLRKSIENALGRSDRLKVFSLIRKHFQNFRDELRQFEARQPDADASSEPPADAPAPEPAADAPPAEPATEEAADTEREPAPDHDGRHQQGGRKKQKTPMYAGGSAQDLQQAMRLNVIFSPPIALNKRSRHRDWDKS